MRQKIIRGNIKTEELLTNLRPANNDYDEKTMLPINLEGGQGKVYKVKCKLD